MLYLGAEALLGLPVPSVFQYIHGCSNLLPLIHYKIVFKLPACFLRTNRMVVRLSFRGRLITPQLYTISVVLFWSVGSFVS